MKIIDRYILKEMASAFFIGIGAFTVVLLLDKIIRLTEMIVTRGIGLLVALRLFLFLLPSFLILTIPMALLLATLTTFGRMASDREITALKTSGVSLYRLLFPPLLFATAAFVLNLFLSIYLLPWGYHAFKNLLFQIARSQVSMALREGVFSSNFGDFVIYVRDIKREGSTLEGILLSDSREKGSFKVIMARKGEVVSDPEGMKTILRLSDGSIHLTYPKDPGMYRELAFAQYELVIDFGRLSENPLGRRKEDREMTFSELLSKIRVKRQVELHPHYVTEFHRKFSIPFSSFLFILIGTPLGIHVRKSGRFSGFSLSIALALSYYLIYILGETLGDKAVVSPALAVWIPNILLGGVGMALLFWEAKEKFVGWPSLALKSRK